MPDFQHAIPRVVTAIRDAAGRLFIESWSIDSTSNAITRLPGPVEDEPISALALSGVLPTPPNTPIARFVTAIKDVNGSRKLISWQVEGNGSITRLGDSGPGVGEIELFSITPISNGIFVTAEVGTNLVPTDKKKN